MGIKTKLYAAYARQSSRKDALQFLTRLLGLDGKVFDGGPGSGNFNHSGRPGEVGGSAKGEGGNSETSGSEKSSSKYYAENERRRGIALKWSPEKQAEHLFRQGYLTEEEAVESMENGTAADRINEYFDLMEYNGDPTPTKPVRKSPDIAEEIRNGEHGGDWEQARKDYIKDWTGQSDEQVEKTFTELQTWFGGSWGRADTDTLDNYIDSDGVYEKDIFRGMHFTEDEYAAFMENVRPGSRIGMNGHNSSWTTDRETAWGFARNGDRNVIIHCVKNKTSAPVGHLSSKGESEVLAHSCAQWTVIGMAEGTNRTELTVIEAEERMSKGDRDRRKAASDEKPEETREVTLGDRMNEQNRFLFVTPPPKDLFKHRTSAEDGGPGSGNWGHKGRPGHVGGSGKGGGKQYRGGRSDVQYVGSRKDWLNGLTGEKQHKAVRHIASIKRNMEDKKQVRDNIEYVWKEGLVTREEADRLLKSCGVDNFRDNMTPEEFTMVCGKPSEKSELLGMMQEARGWKENANRLINENWDENDKKLAAALADKYGRKYEGGTEMPDDSETEDWEDEDLVCWHDLQSKALGGPTSGKEAPDELQYEAGLKERPAPPEPPKPQEPDYSWYKPTDTGNMEAYLKYVTGGQMQYGHNYTEDEFRKLNQDFVNAIKYNKLSPNTLSYYGTIAVQSMRQRMGLYGLNKPSDEMLGRLSDDEKQTLLDTVNRFKSMDPKAFVADTVDSIDKLSYADMQAAEDVITRLNMNKFKSSQSQQVFRDYILIQEKMLTGATPATDEEVAEKKRMEEEQKKAEEENKKRSEEERRAAISNSPEAKQRREAAAAMRKRRENGESVRESSGIFIEQAGSTHYEKAAQAIDQCSNIDGQVMWDIYAKDIGVNKTTGGCKYIPDEDKVYLNINQIESGTAIAKPMQTTFHEVGHAIDHRASVKFGYSEECFSEAWNNGEFCDTIEQEVEAYANEVKNDFNAHIKDTDYLLDHYYERFTSAWYDIYYGRKKPKWSVATKRVGVVKKLNGEKKIEISAICDMVQGATGSAIMPCMGHKKWYYQGDDRRTNMATEAFANLYGQMVTNPEGYAMSKKHFPRTVACFERMIKEIAERG